LTEQSSSRQEEKERKRQLLRERVTAPPPPHHPGTPSEAAKIGKENLFSGRRRHPGREVYFSDKREKRGGGSTLAGWSGLYIRKRGNS